MSDDLTTLSERGPHPVGNTSFELSDPRNPGRLLPVDVWYPGSPVEDGSLGEPDAEHLLNLPHRAHRDLAAAQGVFPLILFSHGNSGYRQQSTFLTAHLASWGFVVAAPDHKGNTFGEMMVLSDEADRKRVHFEARRNRPIDLLAVADHLLNRSENWPGIDPDCVLALGHSYGGWTSIKMPGIDSRIRAVCGLAPASEPFVGRRAFEPDELPFSPALPSLLIAGGEDLLVDLENSVRPLRARMTAPSGLIVIDGADHFHFCDGIPLLHGLHEKNVRPQFEHPPYPYAELLSEERMHRIVRGLVTSFFRSVLALAEPDPLFAFAPDALQALDPAIRAME
jgi:predicted dienelactone hydrolase